MSTRARALSSEQIDEVFNAELCLSQDAAQRAAVERCVQWNGYRRSAFNIEANVASASPHNPVADLGQCADNFLSRTQGKRRH